MFPELSALLRRRESVIADHARRDRDPAAHLDALKEVSLAITAWAEKNRANLDPRLVHFLGNASFAKALAFLEDQRQEKCGGR